MPFGAGLYYGQQFLITCPIVAFCRVVLGGMESYRMQPIIPLLQQYGTGSIYTRIHINNEATCEVR